MLINPIKRFVAKVFGRLPLRTVFIVPFVLQISTAVGIVGYLSFINGQRAVYELSTQLQRQISWRIYLHLDTYLRMPQLLNQSNENTLQQGLLKPSSLPELESFFLRQMRAFDLVPYTAWGNEKGEYIGIDRQRDGTLHVEVVDDPTHPKFYTYDVNPQGQRGKLLQITPFYDPRTRPWYQNAMAQRKATWSSIYVWFNQTEMAIDATLPVYDSNGTLLGVFDTPLKLSRISDYLRQLKISPSGQSFIIERSGLLVASSHEAKPFIMGNDNQPHRLNAADSKNPLIQSTARYLIQRFGNLNQVDTPTQIAFLNNHQRQFVQVVPFQDGRGIDWLIIVVIPEADFMAQINANTRTTLMLCIATVVLATVIGNLTSSWVIQPISHLNAAASNIARGEWDKRVELEHADELGDLAHSFNSMAEKIQTSMAEMKALNEVLAQQEHRLTHYLEALPMGVSVHEANSQIFYINQAGKQILGQGLRPEASREQLAETYQIYKAGTNQLYPTEQLPALQALQGKTVTLNDLEIHQQGKIIPLEAKATPIFDDEGNILYALIAFTDITERQQTEKLLAAYNRILETEVAQRTAELTRTNDQLKQEMAERQQAQEALIQSERLFRLLTTLSPVGIFRADASGQTIYANERACQIVGANLENVLGWKWSSYIHPEDLQRVSQTWQQAIAHQSPWQTEYRLLNQEGKISWILAQTDVERDEMGKVIGYVGTLTDISDRKQAELELQQAKAAAEAANRAKSTFLASMSHELRTPLNAIIGFSQLMSRTTNLNPQQQENLRIITSNGEHLLTLVNQVLDFSKIEAERMTLNQTPCDLISLLDDLDSMFQLKAREKALQLVIYSSSNVPQYVQTDEVKLRQILINLLSNAIKFTKEGSVSLKVSTLNTPQNPKPKTQNPTPNTQHPTPNNKQPTT
ncbi:MAG TPA: hypothetical protein DC064_26460, partial [Cyanobacteria bacterium UBA9273]|nr:hypothetical protein [Cyanobacteria bacterium UBA9273]